MKIRVRRHKSRALNPQIQRIVVSRSTSSNTQFWRRVLAGFAFTVFVIGGAVCVGWSNWLALKDIPNLPPSRSHAQIEPVQRWQNSPWDGSVPIVKEYFLRTAHDPDAMEFVEWSPVYNSPQGQHSVRVAVRGKNMVGAKILKQYIVAYNDKVVLSTTPFE